MTTPIAILIDDEPDIRELLTISLKRMGFECLQAGSFREGQNLISATECDLCITDVRMPDGSGIDLVRQFKALHPKTPIAVMTAYDTTEIAIQAMKAGAFDFLAKPIRAQRLEILLADAHLLSKVTTSESTNVSSETIIGNAASIQALREGINRASKSMAPVLITGEPGTGKELIARSIHNQSQRRYGPFISVDCSAIPQELLESEFFGHKSGSFPGANADKAGLLQSANGGSLLINEVADLPPYFQVKLLRVLADRLVTNVGADTKEPVDARIICATNRNLDAEVQIGSFREDLYYHLNVIGLNPPSLRDHPEDIELLSDHILSKIVGNMPMRLEPAALKVLQKYSFFGNVRELENILHRAHVVCKGNNIAVNDLSFSPTAINQDNAASGTGSLSPLEIDDLERYLNQIEKEVITTVLEAERWNRTKAAKRLGLTARQFRYKMSKHQLNKDE